MRLIGCDDTIVGTVGIWSNNMANRFKNLSFNELVEKAEEGMGGNGYMVEASRRIAASTIRLTWVIVLFTATILVLNIFMVFPEWRQ